MLTKDFYFDLPEELIAQHPSTVRGEDKLMVLDRVTGEVLHKAMADLVDLIDENTLMVFNNSRVRRSRCYADKISKNFNEQAATKPVEFMVLENITIKNVETELWRCMVKNAKRQKVGNEYRFTDGTIGTIIENENDIGSEFRTLSFVLPNGETKLTETWFEKNGHIPLPPYIKREDDDEDGERYQNVYANETGSAACPTAGLHFTEELLEKIVTKGIEIAYVTLHVGLGTFLPVRAEKIEDHAMHYEYYSISKESANAINAAKKAGKKILAVGTTSVRTLESAWNSETAVVESGTRSTNIFLHPGCTFNVVDRLFTNFHTPESTLLMLVSAFAGKETIFNAYKKAVECKYMFFSYGDAMLIE